MGRRGTRAGARCSSESPFLGAGLRALPMPGAGCVAGDGSNEAPGHSETVTPCGGVPWAVALPWHYEKGPGSSHNITRLGDDPRRWCLACAEWGSAGFPSAAPKPIALLRALGKQGLGCTILCLCPVCSKGNPKSGPAAAPIRLVCAPGASVSASLVPHEGIGANTAGRCREMLFAAKTPQCAALPPAELLFGAVGSLGCRRQQVPCSPG